MVVSSAAPSALGSASTS
uniref:Uncharacterized protein n=1 Tax=Arundo donax TaxID=35708 RepID=A0A0A9G979_ARUDO